MKATAGNGKRSGFNWKGDPIVKRLGHGDMTLFYTQAQWERRQARLALVANASKSDYNTDTKQG